jgi:hypothetical protein
MKNNLLKLLDKHDDLWQWTTLIIIVFYFADLQ